MGDKTKKYPNKVHYLGEPCQLALGTVAGNVPRNNSTESIIGQVDVCPPAPNPRILLASTRHGCESIELIHHSTNSDVYPHPPPSPLTLQHDPKTYNYTLLKNLKVANGDISEIVASMLSPC